MTANRIHAPPPMLCIAFCTAAMHAGIPSGCLRLNEGNRGGSLLLSNGDSRLQLPGKHPLDPSGGLLT